MRHIYEYLSKDKSSLINEYLLGKEKTLTGKYKSDVLNDIYGLITSKKQQEIESVENALKMLDELILKFEPIETLLKSIVELCEDYQYIVCSKNDAISLNGRYATLYMGDQDEPCACIEICLDEKTYTVLNIHELFMEFSCSEKGKPHGCDRECKSLDLKSLAYFMHLKNFTKEKADNLKNLIVNHML